MRVVSRRAAMLGLGIPHLAWAQQAGRAIRVCSLHIAPWTSPHHVAFRAALARAGLIEGQSVLLDPDGHGLRRDAFDPHARTMVGRGIDLFHVSGDPAVRAALAASPSLPILAVADDIVGSGFAAGYAQPGGRVTGVSVLGATLDQKRMEILLELLPGARRIAALGDALLTSPAQVEAQVAAARGRGVTLSASLIRTPEEIRPALVAARDAGAEAVNVLATPLLFNARALIFEQAAELRLPAIYQWPDMAREGGLIAYGPSIVQIYRDQVAPMFLRLARGTLPAALPIEQPSRFELVINRRTAGTLGIAVPPGLLARADEVID